jgi:hypothetical protein
MIQMIEIKNLENIITYSHNDESTFLDTIWGNIIAGNRNVDLQTSFHFLAVLVRLLLKSDQIQLYDVGIITGNRKEYQGSPAELEKMLLNFLSKYDEKSIKRDPNFLERFEFTGVSWLVPYSVEDIILRLVRAEKLQG